MNLVWFFKFLIRFNQEYVCSLAQYFLFSFVFNKKLTCSLVSLQIDWRILQIVNIDSNHLLDRNYFWKNAIPYFSIFGKIHKKW